MLVHKDEIIAGYRPLSNMQVYKIKRYVNENIVRFKIRWVVKNYLQQLDLEFDPIFIAIVNLIVFGVFFAIAVFYNLDINLMNVKTIFFYSFINQLIYIKIPKYMKTKTNKNMLCQLLKILYILKQCLCFWYERFFIFLLK